jgi:sec-independent protein translocase protein TatA
MNRLLGFGLSGYEIWIVLLVALLLFGHRIPGMARSLGAGIVEFKKGLKSGAEEEPKIGDGSERKEAESKSES